MSPLGSRGAGAAPCSSIRCRTKEAREVMGVVLKEGGGGGRKGIDTEVCCDDANQCIFACARPPPGPRRRTGSITPLEHVPIDGTGAIDSVTFAKSPAFTSRVGFPQRDFDLGLRKRTGQTRKTLLFTVEAPNTPDPFSACHTARHHRCLSPTSEPHQQFAVEPLAGWVRSGGNKVAFGALKDGVVIWTLIDEGRFFFCFLTHSFDCNAHLEAFNGNALVVKRSHVSVLQSSFQQNTAPAHEPSSTFGGLGSSWPKAGQSSGNIAGN